MVWPEAAIASTYQVWRSCTVTAAVCGVTPIAMAVIVAVPLPTAVILPLESTLATPLASVLHTSPRADVGLPAESSTVAATGAMSPVASVSDPGGGQRHGHDHRHGDRRHAANCRRHGTG